MIVLSYTAGVDSLCMEAQESNMAKPFQDIVVIIPGILGSVLTREEERWGLSVEALFGAIMSGGNSLYDLELEGTDDWTQDMDDSVVATGLLTDAHMIPGLWKIDGYSALIRRLTRRFKLVEGENLRSFPYDWRRDNRAAARHLLEESPKWLAEQRERGAVDPQLILVCHSMGGLVARYFLEVLGGWKSTQRLITFGTPYRGSLNSVDALANGISMPFIKLDKMTQLCRSLTSVYQLLPTYKCIDSNSNGWVRAADANLPNLDPHRLQLATEFHREIEEAVTANADNDDYLQNGYTTHPVRGVKQATKQSARVIGSEVEVFQHFDGEDLRGDGTVPYMSSIPLEWKDPATGIFIDTTHAGMQNRTAGLFQVEGILRGSTVNAAKYRAATSWLEIDSDDIYPAGDIEIELTNVGGRTLKAQLDSLTGELPITAKIQAMTNNQSIAVFQNVPAGGWRITVESDTSTVTDLLLVVNG